jgi:hypothetical protein
MIVISDGRLLELLEWNLRTGRKEIFGDLLSGGGKAMEPEVVGKVFAERIAAAAQTIRKQSGNVLHFIQHAMVCLYSRALSPLISRQWSF